MKVNEADQFMPDAENVRSILSQYGLAVDRFSAADSGIENCTIHIWTSRGRYVLRVYRRHGKSDSQIRREINFMAYLQVHGIPVPIIIQNQSGDKLTHGTVNGERWQAILMDFVVGNHRDAYEDPYMANLARLQARMHVLAADYSDDFPVDPPMGELRESHFLARIKDRAVLEPRRAGFIDRVASFVYPLEPRLPHGLCHMDYDNGNILALSGEITAILDFDDLRESPFVACLAYTIWDIAFDHGLDAARRYVELYEKHRPLNDLERRSLMPVMLFRHYAIGTLDISDRDMSDASLERYVELESELVQGEFAGLS